MITLPTRLRLTASVADGEPRRYNLRLPESHCVLRLAELRSVAELGKIQHNITATIPHCPKGYDFTVAAIEAFVGVDLPTLAAASRYDGFVQLLTECCALEVCVAGSVWVLWRSVSAGAGASAAGGCHVGGKGQCYTRHDQTSGFVVGGCRARTRLFRFLINPKRAP